MADSPVRAANHAAHDLELVARVAAGDGSVADDQAAAGLRSACVECASLDADLRAIAAGVRELASLPARPAPRDFRLSARDADRLRAGRIRGLLAGLRGSRRSVRGPIGGGLVAIGLVGMLIGSGFPGGLTGLGAAGAASGPEQDVQKDNPSAAATLAPAQSTFGQVLASTSPEGGLAIDRAARPAATWSQGVVVLSAVAVVIGLGLLLAARGGRRAGP